MSDLKYKHVRRILREQLIMDLDNSDPETVANALYAATRYEEDTDWVQKQCLGRLTSPEAVVRWAAATCLGDLALLRRPLNAKMVIPALELAKEDPAIADPASFSLSMIKQFLEP